jgi:hypothetical protein
VLSWVAAAVLIYISIWALWEWPNPVDAVTGITADTGIGETVSAWALNATVLLGTYGFFAMSIHPDKFWWNLAPFVLSLGALILSNPALSEVAFAPAAPFAVTVLTLVLAGFTAFSVPTHWRRPPTAAQAIP